MRTALEIVFWTSAALIVWTQVGYAVALEVIARTHGHTRGGSLGGRSSSTVRSSGELPAIASSGLPTVALIVAAHNEQSVIEAKVQNALALDYPRDRLRVVVACDGCTDETPRLAAAAGADAVLELPRGGKIAAQDAAVERAGERIVAFSDANALWEPDALRMLVGAFDDPKVGYACGQVRFVQGLPAEHTPHRSGHAAQRAQATNQEHVYWRYEMAIRERESRLSSITAGNGAIYATRRDAYIVVDPIMGHDLSFPFNMVKRGWRAVYVPQARATEKMVPSIEGELRRKRRMMSHTWPIVLRGGMLSPHGYTVGYALMILSHRVLRYCTALLHALALVANVALVAGGAGGLYVATLAVQGALVGAAWVGGVAHAKSLLVARYYVLSTLSLALGFWDWLRHGTDAVWEAAEGTR